MAFGLVALRENNRYTRNSLSRSKKLTVETSLIPYDPKCSQNHGSVATTLIEFD